MSEERSPGTENFLARWSRLKSNSADTTAMAPSANQPPVDAMASDAPVLPSIEELTIESDFSGFFHPKVDENVRRTALKKLFSDPRFNVMDGLDVYIDDYTVAEPVPAAMLAGLRQAQRIVEWAQESSDADDTGHLSEEGAPAALACVPADTNTRTPDAATRAADEPQHDQ